MNLHEPARGADRARRGGRRVPPTDAAPQGERTLRARRVRARAVADLVHAGAAASAAAAAGSARRHAARRSAHARDLDRVDSPAAARAGLYAAVLERAFANRPPRARASARARAARAQCGALAPPRERRARTRSTARSSSSAQRPGPGAAARGAKKRVPIFGTSEVRVESVEQLLRVIDVRPGAARRRPRTQEKRGRRAARAGCRWRAPSAAAAAGGERARATPTACARKPLARARCRRFASLSRAAVGRRWRRSGRARATACSRSSTRSGLASAARGREGGRQADADRRAPHLLLPAASRELVIRARPQERATRRLRGSKLAQQVLKSSLVGDGAEARTPWSRSWRRARVAAGEQAQSEVCARPRRAVAGGGSA